MSAIPTPNPGVYVPPQPVPLSPSAPGLTFWQQAILGTVKSLGPAILILGGLIGYHEFYAKPDALTVDPVKLGKALAPDLASSYADGCLAFAATLEQGKTMVDGQKALQDTYLKSRTAAFNAKVAPEFAKILTEGVEPADFAKRAEVVKFYRDLAKGLKGGR